MGQALTIHPVPVADLLPLLSVLEHAKTDTTAGAIAASELERTSRGYRVDLEGVPVMGYTLQMSQHTKKRVCWITAAVGAANGHDLTGEVLPLIEAQARQAGAHQIAITTKRAGLAKKIQAHGFCETGVTYRKNLQ